MKKIINMKNKVVRIENRLNEEKQKIKGKDGPEVEERDWKAK